MCIFEAQIKYMLPKDAKFFASFHPDDEVFALSALSQVKAAGWNNIVTLDKHGNTEAVSKLIEQSEMVLIFLSKTYARDERLMLEEFAYASVVVRKPFLPVWLDDIADIQRAIQSTGQDRQLLSALEMLTAKHTGTTAGNLAAALAQFTPDTPPYTPSTPQVCEKPCEAYEGNEPYIFISYAHDDAKRVYPIVKELYESGWDLWYDEGIKTTERYMPVIADNLNRCAVFVLMLTNRCLARPFVMNCELEYARQRGIPVIPVLLEELNPPSYARKVVAGLLENALAPESLLGSVAAERLPNRGTRVAVPPAAKQNVVYDVILPPEVPGFEIAIRDSAIVLTKYVGKEIHVVIPDKVATPNGEMVFRIVAISEGAFGGCRSLTNIIIPKGVTNIDNTVFRGCISLTNVTIPEGVPSIGDDAFDGCSSLISIIIPKSVTRIGNKAFVNCKSLASLKIPDSVLSIGDMAFNSCKSLTDIAIPKSVTRIGNRVFEDCESLTSIKMPDSIVSIGDNAFAKCKALIDITVPKSITRIANRTFADCESLASLKIPDNVISIGDEAFKGCKLLVAINIPDSVINIGDRIFSDCHELGLIYNTSKTILFHHPEKSPATTYVFLESITTICSGAFRCCESLTDIIIPDGIESIGVETFYGCSSLAVVTIPKSVTRIGNRAFEDCKALSSIKMPDNVISIGEGAFSGCKSLTDITIPNGITSIGFETFRGCESLSTVTIPHGVTSIGNIAFEDCARLTNIEIPESVTSIGNIAFADCKNLSRINIPEGIMEIGYQTFFRCRKLNNITLPKSIRNICNQAFSGCASLTDINIPKGVMFIDRTAFEDTPMRRSTLVRARGYYISLQSGDSRTNKTEQPQSNNIDIIQQNLPRCNETSRALVCCAEEDLPHIRMLLIELYWEGFSIYYERSPDQKVIKESQCVLAFFSERTAESKSTMGSLKYAIQMYASRIIQVFLKNWASWPDEIRERLHDRQAIFQSQCTEREFTGKIRESLRTFNCSLEHPRGYDVKTHGDSVEIVKFHPTGFPEVIIPKTFFSPPLPVTSIGKKAFSDCEALTNIMIPDSVTNIGDDAFNGCASLTDINIPDGIISFGEFVFTECHQLGFVFNTSKTIFYNYPQKSRATSYVLPKGVKIISNCAFYLNESLTKIKIPKGVEGIGNYAFSTCKALVGVKIPKGVQSIGKGAFGDCESLIYIIIPNGMTSIGDGAFENCTSLTEIRIPKSVINIGENILNGCKKSLTVYAPNNSAGNYYARSNFMKVDDSFLAHIFPHICVPRWINIVFLVLTLALIVFIYIILFRYVYPNLNLK